MEQWKELKVNESTFKVSNKGNILRLKKDKWLEVGQSLFGGHEGKRYLSVCDKQKTYYVHRLVAEAWIGPIPKGYEVNHKDTDKWNNEASNLEIVTSQENQIHSWTSGARDSQKIPQHELDRRYIKKEIHKMNNQWLVLNLNFNILSRHDSHVIAAKSINVSRQAANGSFRLGRPILKQYFICKPKQVEELKNRIFGNSFV